METVDFGQAVLLHPRCSWGDLTKRARPLGGSKGLRELQRQWNRRDEMVEQIKTLAKEQKCLSLMGDEFFPTHNSTTVK
jgi:hypothetical protein